MWGNAKLSLFLLGFLMAWFQERRLCLELCVLSRLMCRSLCHFSDYSKFRIFWVGPHPFKVGHGVVRCVFPEILSRKVLVSGA